MGEFKSWEDLCRMASLARDVKAVRVSKKTLDDALSHLHILVSKAMERELDWIALSQELEGKPNPEYDARYASKVMNSPEEVFATETWAAKEFLKRLGK